MPTRVESKKYYRIVKYRGIKIQYCNINSNENIAMLIKRLGVNDQKMIAGDWIRSLICFGREP